MNGNLTIVQYAYMCLIILATSSECRDKCRNSDSCKTFVKFIDNFSKNSVVVRDSCIGIASLIYCRLIIINILLILYINFLNLYMKLNILINLKFLILGSHLQKAAKFFVKMMRKLH
jgi:uncharacterized membrane protein YfhO